MPTSDHVEIISDQVGDIVRVASRHVLCDTADYQLTGFYCRPGDSELGSTVALPLPIPESPLPLCSFEYFCVRQQKKRNSSRSAMSFSAMTGVRYYRPEDSELGIHRAQNARPGGEGGSSSPPAHCQRRASLLTLFLTVSLLTLAYTITFPLPPSRVPWTLQAFLTPILRIAESPILRLQAFVTPMPTCILCN